MSLFLRVPALLCFAVVFTLGNCQAQQPTATNTITSQRAEKMAIEDSIAGYLIAINEKDAQAASSFWSENGEWIAEDGSRIRGKAAIADALANSFVGERADMTVSLRNLNIRLVSSTVAIEDGLAVISVPGEEDEEASYSVVHVKEDGSWKIDSVRETQVPAAATQSAPLTALAWMVGDWQDVTNGGLSIQSSCRWTPGEQSLRRSFQISEDGEVVKQGTQVIMWDARLGKIRSWMFDSEGGFGNGVWEQQGDSGWVVNFEFQLSDGSVATASNIYSGIEGSRFDFQSVNRELDGIPVEDTPVVTVLRSETENVGRVESLERMK